MRVEEANWQEHREAMTAIRYRVFVEEQKVPQDIELDEHDASCRHVLAYDEDGRAIGTGRLVDQCRVGRMAVLPPWRNRGVGAAMLEKLIEMARDSGQVQVILHAQITAQDFYLRHGFEPVGPEFIEAGIRHQEMILQL